jgi:hypothetical protein
MGDNTDELFGRDGLDAGADEVVELELKLWERSSV